MGHKVNPVGFRIGINRDWNSRWYAEGKQYAKFLNEDIKIREYLKEKCKKALVSHIEIERKNISNNKYKLDVAVFVALIAEVRGSSKETDLTEELTKGVKKISKNDNARVNIVLVDKPDLDASIVAQKIALDLENRASFRSAQKIAISRVRKAGAKGIRTLVGGRLGGADIARNEGYKEGIIPLHTLRSDIDFATAEAETTYGRLGVKVWICRGDYKTAEEIKAEKEKESLPVNKKPFSPRSVEGGKK